MKATASIERLVGQNAGRLLHQFLAYSASGIGLVTVVVQNPDHDQPTPELMAHWLSVALNYLYCCPQMRILVLSKSLGPSELVRILQSNVVSFLDKSNHSILVPLIMLVFICK